MLASEAATKKYGDGHYYWEGYEDGEAHRAAGEKEPKPRLWTGMDSGFGMWQDYEDGYYDAFTRGRSRFDR